MTILALDPSTTSLGWAIGLRSGKLLELGTLKPEAEYANDRVGNLVEALSRLWYDKGPFEVIAMEKASGYQNKQGKYIVPPELTALMTRLRQWAHQQVQVELFEEYHPSTVRAAIGASSKKGANEGLSVKQRIRAGVLRKHPALNGVKSSQDAIDAVAVLDCWLVQHDSGEDWAPGPPVVGGQLPTVEE